MAKNDGLIVFLGTEDMEATNQFYNQMLGLPLWKDQGLCRIYTVPGGGKLGFCTHVPVVKADKSPILTLVTDAVDEVFASLVDEGWQTEHSPAENSRFKIYHFFVRDPNGYLVEVQRFLD